MTSTEQYSLYALGYDATEENLLKYRNQVTQYIATGNLPNNEPNNEPIAERTYTPNLITGVYESNDMPNTPREEHDRNVADALTNKKHLGILALQNNAENAVTASHTNKNTGVNGGASGATNLSMLHAVLRPLSGINKTITNAVKSITAGASVVVPSEINSGAETNAYLAVLRNPQITLGAFVSSYPQLGNRAAFIWNLAQNNAFKTDSGAGSSYTVHEDGSVNVGEIVSKIKGMMNIKTIMVIGIVCLAVFFYLKRSK